MKRLLSLLPVLAFCLLFAPAVLAETVQGVLYQEGDQQKTCATATVVTADETAWNGDNTNGWYVVNNTVTISSRVTVTGSVRLILADGASLTVNGGIQVAEGNALTIYAQSADGNPGVLTAKAGSVSNAGIGGNKGGNGGTVTIYGGTVTAWGGKEESGGTQIGGAGIGGGYQGNGGTVNIYGGTVKAQGGMGGSGIGGGEGGSGGTVNISGGTVTATGGGYGAGIGGGYKGNGGDVTISGGTVTATGGSGSPASGSNGAGIGGGDKGSGGTVNISGGTVTATGGGNGAGIGSGKRDGNQGTFSTGEKGNAVILASSIGDASKQDKWQGIVFQGEKGLVYGTGITPEEDFTLPEGKTLEIEAGKTVTIQNGVTMTNNGTLIIEEGGTLTVAKGGILTNEGTLTNNETLTVAKGGALTNQGTLTNNETLNIAKGGTLTNEGTIENYGTVEGSITRKALPQINTQPQNAAVREGEVAQFTVEATVSSGNPTYQWQRNTAASGSNWVNIETATGASYTTGTTTTAMNNYQYRCIVKGTGGFTISSAATLTVNTVAVTSVTLDKTSLDLVVEGTATLKATVTPDAADNTVTWASSNQSIATVKAGSDGRATVTAVAPGTATITVTAADGSGKSASCKVTVSAKSYGLSIDPGAVGFGTAAPGYTQPAVREVVVRNTGNQTLALTQPTAEHFEVGSLNLRTLAPGEKAVFTVRPKAGLPLGSYSETVVVKANGGAGASVNLTFVVSDGSTANERCTLHFNTMGGLEMEDVQFGLGAPVELWPYTPVRVGYLFQGWYKDEALTQPVSTLVLVENTTIYAKWAPDPAAQAAAPGSGTGSGSGSGSGGSGSGGKATPTPTPTATPEPTPEVTPTPEPTATPEATPEATAAPEESGGGFPVFPVAAGVIVLAAAAGVFFLLNRRKR